MKSCAALGGNGQRGRSAGQSRGDERAPAKLGGPTGRWCASLLPAATTANQYGDPHRDRTQDYSLYQQGRAESSAQPAGGSAADSERQRRLWSASADAEIAALYNNGNAGRWWPNVGMLVAAHYQGDLPEQQPGAASVSAVSHSDQANQWQTAIPNGRRPLAGGGPRGGQLLAPVQFRSRHFPPSRHRRLRPLLHRRADVWPPLCGGRGIPAGGATTPSRLAA